MAELAPYTVAPGTIGNQTQPTLSLDDDAVLRPWTDSDATALQAAYADPDIQRWHVRELDSLHVDGHHDMHTHTRLADVGDPPQHGARDTPTTACST